MPSYYLDFNGVHDGNFAGVESDPWQSLTSREVDQLVAGDILFVRGRCMTTTNKDQFGAESFSTIPTGLQVRDWPGSAPAVIQAVLDLPTTGWTNPINNQWMLAGATLLSLFNNPNIGVGGGRALANVAALAAAINEVMFEHFATAADAGNIDINASGAQMSFLDIAATAVATESAPVSWFCDPTTGNLFVNVPATPNETYSPDWSRWFRNGRGTGGVGLPRTLPRLCLAISHTQDVDYVRFNTVGLRWSAAMRLDTFSPSSDWPGYAVQMNGGDNIMRHVTAANCAFHSIGSSNGINLNQIFENCYVIINARSNVSSSLYVTHSAGGLRNPFTRDRQVINSIFWNCDSFASDLLSAARTGRARTGRNGAANCDAIYCHGDGANSRCNQVLFVGGKIVLGNMATSLGRWGNLGGAGDVTGAVTAGGALPPIPQHFNLWFHNIRVLYTNLQNNTAECPQIGLRSSAITNSHFNLTTPGNTATIVPSAARRGQVILGNNLLVKGCLFTGRRAARHVWFVIGQSGGPAHYDFRKCTFSFENSIASPESDHYHYLFGTGFVSLTGVSNNLSLRGCVIDMQGRQNALLHCQNGYTSDTGDTLVNVQATFHFQGNTYITPTGGTWRWIATELGADNTFLGIFTTANFTAHFEVIARPGQGPVYLLGSRNAAHFDTQANGVRPRAGCVLAGVPGHTDTPMAHPLLPGPLPTGLGAFEGIERGCWPITQANYGYLNLGPIPASGVVPALQSATRVGISRPVQSLIIVQQ